MGAPAASIILSARPKSAKSAAARAGAISAMKTLRHCAVASHGDALFSLAHLSPCEHRIPGRLAFDAPIPRLARQRALPDSEKELFKPDEIPGPKFRAPFALDIAKDLVDLGVGGVAALCKTDNAGPASIGCSGPDDVAETLEATEKLVHGLLADAGSVGEHAWANSIRTWKLEHRHVRQAQLMKSGPVEPLDQPAVDGLRGHAKQRPDEHLFGPGRSRKFLLDIHSKLRLHSTIVNGIYYKEMKL